MNYLQQLKSHLIRFNFSNEVIDRLSSRRGDLARYTFFSVLSNYYTKRYLVLMSLKRIQRNIFSHTQHRAIRDYKIWLQFLNLNIYLHFFWSYSHKTIQKIYKFNLIWRNVSTFVFCLMLLMKWWFFIWSPYICM